MVLNCKLKVLLIFVLLGVVGGVKASDSLRVEKIGQEYFVIHRVEKGETLYSLSRRYDSHLNEVVRANSLENNEIAVGQELKFPIQPVSIEEKEEATTISKAAYHTVQTGETLYSISKKYGLSVAEIKRLNNLSSNAITVGQDLKVGAGKNVATGENTRGTTKANPSIKEEAAVPVGFSEYYVQNGDVLSGIARKFNVRPDSIVIWNHLPNTYLKIGQKLLIKGQIDRELEKRPGEVVTTSYAKIRKSTDQSGFVKIFEEGVARKIETSIDTDKYLALHRTLPLGSLIEVRNLMNNQRVFARVVGKLPETGLNEKVLVRLTPVCFERLGVIDPKTRVEVSYYEE